jgi:hypothetical protein
MCRHPPRLRGSSINRGVPSDARTPLRGLALSVILLLGTEPLLGVPTLSAEQPLPIKMGALTEAWGPTPAMVGLRDGLLALGYREGDQFVIGVRFTQGDVGMLAAAARELVGTGANLLIASGTSAARAAQMATTRLPIVFVEATDDPVEAGLVQSFAHPGGNITGVSDLDLEFAPERLELFKEMIPGLKRVLAPYDLADAGLRGRVVILTSWAQRGAGGECEPSGALLLLTSRCPERCQRAFGSGLVGTALGGRAARFPQAGKGAAAGWSGQP